MPSNASSKKRLRQNEARRNRNRIARSQVRTCVKQVRKAVEEGDVSKAEDAFKLAAKKLDRAGAKNLIHRNAAARTKSRLQHLIKAAKQSD